MKLIIEVIRTFDCKLQQLKKICAIISKKFPTDSIQEALASHCSEDDH